MIHRWPSARPDAIVTEEEYYRVKRSILPSNIAKALTKRVPWERGLQQNYTGSFIISLKVRVHERILVFLKTSMAISHSSPIPIWPNVGISSALWSRGH